MNLKRIKLRRTKKWANILGHPVYTFFDEIVFEQFWISVRAKPQLRYIAEPNRFYYFLLSLSLFLFSSVPRELVMAKGVCVCACVRACVLRMVDNWPATWRRKSQRTDGPAEPFSRSRPKRTTVRRVAADRRHLNVVAYRNFSVHRNPVASTPEMKMGQRVRGHRSNRSPFFDGSHASWVTASDPLTHDEITAQ